MRRQTTAPSRVLVIISTIVVALVLLLASGVDATADVTANTESYTVRSGDTIWDIAAVRTPDGFDVRDTVAAIQAMNRLSRSTIHPGQTLEVPLD